MDKITQKLKNIEVWVDFNLPLPSEFKTNAESINFVVEVMNRCLYLLRVGVASAPDAKTAKTGYAKPEAVIVGYMVQLTKLYEGALIQFCGAQSELTRIFFSLILEVARNIEHLILSNRQSTYSSVSTAYSPELKTFRESEDKEKKYTFPSETINPIDRDWHDIHSHHLIQKGDYYTPNLRLDEPNLRLGCQLTHVCLETLLTYLQWNKSDPDEVITTVVVKLHELNLVLDAARESTLGE